MENMATLCQYNGVEFTHIHQPALTLKNQHQLREKLLHECDRLQKEIWNPTYPIEENTINNDGLTLLSKNGSYIGFLSYNVAEYGDQKVVYFNDLMVGNTFQGHGYFRTGLMYSILCVMEKYNLKNFLGMTITYNSRIIKSLYFKPHIFKNISFPRLGDEHKNFLRENGHNYFEKSALDIETGLIKSMWKGPKFVDQHLSNLPELADLFGAELDVSGGDSLVLMFEVDQDSKANIQGFLNERVKYKGITT